MLTAEIARERVARGAALLDVTVPGWASAVDVGRLCLSDCKVCVLGQLGAGLRGDEADRYEAMGRRLDLWGESKYHPSPKMSQHGFDANDFCTGNTAALRDAYARLQDAWIEAIADRVVPRVNPPTVGSDAERAVQKDVLSARSAKE